MSPRHTKRNGDDAGKLPQRITQSGNPNLKLMKIQNYTIRFYIKVINVGQSNAWVTASITERLPSWESNLGTWSTCTLHAATCENLQKGLWGGSVSRWAPPQVSGRPVAPLMCRRTLIFSLIMRKRLCGIEICSGTHTRTQCRTSFTLLKFSLWPDHRFLPLTGYDNN